jgi:hypothetical protein
MTGASLVARTFAEYGQADILCQKKLPTPDRSKVAVSPP